MILGFQEFAERRSPDKLHHYESRRLLVVSFAEIVNRDHVWMAQHRCCSRFSAKARKSGIVLDELASQDLYRHIVFDMNAPSTIDHAHTALAQLRREFILAVDYVAD